MPRASFKQKPKRASAIKFDLRLAWVLPAAILFSLPFVQEGYYAILGSTLAAMVACLLAMASVGYSLTSFVSLVALTHLLFYPLAVCGQSPAAQADGSMGPVGNERSGHVGVYAGGLGAGVGRIHSHSPGTPLPGIFIWLKNLGIAFIQI